MSVDERFHINLNQNLWGLALSYAALGVAERFGLTCLIGPALWLAGGLSVLVFIAFVFYTVHYCTRKAVQTGRLCRGKPTLAR